MMPTLTLGLLWTPSLEWMVEVALVLLVAFFASFAWRRFIGLLWAVGADRERLLAFTNPPIRFALALWVWSVVVGIGPSPQVLDNSQLGFHTTVYGSSWAWEAFMPAFFTILITIWGFKNLRDVASGLVLSVTRPFRIGDEVATGTAHGRVSSIGLTRVRVKTPVGELVDVPASELASSTVRIAARQGGALPVKVEVALSGAQAPDRAVELLRDHALLSIYTDASVPVMVEMLSDRRARIVATPVHPDDADELRSDLTSRAASLANGGNRRLTTAAIPSQLTVPAPRG